MPEVVNLTSGMSCRRAGGVPGVVEVAQPGQQVITQQAFVQPPRPFVGLREGQVPFGDEFGELFLARPTLAQCSPI